MRNSRWPEPFLRDFFLRPSAARPMRAFSSFRFFIFLCGGAAGGWLPPPSSAAAAAAAASAPRLASLRPGRGYRRSAGPRPLCARRPRGSSPGPATAARPARAMAAPGAAAARPLHLQASRVPIGQRGAAPSGFKGPGPRSAGAEKRVEVTRFESLSRQVKGAGTSLPAYPPGSQR